MKQVARSTNVPTVKSRNGRDVMLAAPPSLAVAPIVRSPPGACTASGAYSEAMQHAQHPGLPNEQQDASLQVRSTRLEHLARMRGCLSAAC